ncbi:MAG: hypothetical protein P4M11_11630 [Candidatus Pacebacteria bacterium]|nr:hypothetical protein [Candidatus Paceibacterota bacterium]
MNGPAEVKKHYWFQETNWQDIADRKAVAPFYPSSKDYNFDIRKSIREEPDDEEHQKLYEQIMKRDEVQNYFDGYYYDCENTMLPKRSKTPPKEKDPTMEESLTRTMHASGTKHE